MPSIVHLRDDIQKYLQKHGLAKKREKAKKLYREFRPRPGILNKDVFRLRLLKHFSTSIDDKRGIAKIETICRNQSQEIVLEGAATVMIPKQHHPITVVFYLTSASCPPALRSLIYNEIPEEYPKSTIFPITIQGITHAT